MQEKIGLILLAAGSGKRMKADKNKILLTIDGAPIVVKALNAFLAADVLDDVVVVVRPAEQAEIEAALAPLGITYTLAHGGLERQDSVYNGLLALDDAITHVMVHDSARPYIAPHTVKACAQSLLAHGSGVVGVFNHDTVKRVADGKIVETLDRTHLINIQTPQCFDKKTLMVAHKQAQADGFVGTDESVLVERLKKPVYFVAGEYSNTKVTTPADLKDEDRKMTIGHGMDVHAFANGRKLILGGELIPHSRGLQGHSDADVLTHAVMDALLGAAGLADIGQLFPDTDTSFKGADSVTLLQQVGTLLNKNGYAVGNVDATLAMQAPKVGKYIPAMRSNLAAALGVAVACVNVKATTTEHLGFVGRSEGVVCHAVCLLTKK